MHPVSYSPHHASLGEVSVSGWVGSGLGLLAQLTGTLTWLSVASSFKMVPSFPGSLISLWILTLFHPYFFLPIKSCFLSFLCIPFKILQVSEFARMGFFCFLSWQDLESSWWPHACQASILPFSCVSSPSHVLLRWRHFFNPSNWGLWPAVLLEQHVFSDLHHLGFYVYIWLDRREREGLIEKEINYLHLILTNNGPGSQEQW